MQVYVLFYMPFGAPALWCDIFGVYSTEEKCLEAKALYVEDGYDENEVVYAEKQLDLIYLG